MQHAGLVGLRSAAPPSDHVPPVNEHAIDWPALTAARRARIRNPHDAPPAEVLEADAWFTANWSVIPGCTAALLAKDNAVEARKARPRGRGLARSSSCRRR